MLCTWCFTPFNGWGSWNLGWLTCIMPLIQPIGKWNENSGLSWFTFYALIHSTSFPLSQSFFLRSVFISRDLPSSRVSAIVTLSWKKSPRGIFNGDMAPCNYGIILVRYRILMNELKTKPKQNRTKNPSNSYTLLFKNFKPLSSPYPVKVA